VYSLYVGLFRLKEISQSTSTVQQYNYRTFKIIMIECTMLLSTMTVWI